MEKSAPSEGAKPVVLALTIGQSPRPALCAPLVGMLPPGVRILEVGALDGITDDEIAALTARADAPDAVYPLVTSMRDGRVVRVEEHDLCRLLNAALRRALTGADAASCHSNGATGVVCAVLLCAGSFTSVRSWPSPVPLLKPYDLARAQLAACIRPRRLALVCAEGQEKAIASRWAAAGYEVAARAAALEGDEPCPKATSDAIASWVAAMQAGIPEVRGVDTCVVIDFVGSAWAEQVAALALAWGAPVVDLGDTLFRTCAALVESACAAEA